MSYFEIQLLFIHNKYVFAIKMITKTTNVTSIE